MNSNFDKFYKHSFQTWLLVHRMQENIGAAKIPPPQSHNIKTLARWRHSYNDHYVESIPRRYIWEYICHKMFNKIFFKKLREISCQSCLIKFVLKNDFYSNIKLISQWSICYRPGEGGPWVQNFFSSVPKLYYSQSLWVILIRRNYFRNCR